MTKIKVPGLKPEGAYGQNYFAVDKNDEISIIGDQARPAILKRFRIDLTEGEIRRHGLTALREDNASSFKDVGNGRFEATGADLLREAIVDWEEFGDGEDSFADWFEGASWIHSNRIYQFDSNLEDITEVEP